MSATSPAEKASGEAFTDDDEEVRNLFIQGRRNNDRPPAPVPEYDPAGNPVVFAPSYF